MLRAIITVLIIYLNKSVLCIKPKVECGYKQCPQTKDGALNVHLIPHSHMDAGWVKTFDEYYYGTRTSVSTANVQLIYHSVLAELLHDKRRKFTFAETAYFWRWWKEQRPSTRATFRSLVLEGRVEFAGGGWVQNDEPTSHYTQIIDQYTWGLRKLNDTLGPCGKPKASWQIDTYGHSREQTSLLAQMGYDGLFIGRVDHRERDAMVEEDRLEFMWRGSDVLGKMSDIMTHTLYNLYNAPDGFCFDFLCNDEPIVDDPDNQVYNAEKRVNDFIVQIERQAKYYDHDNIIVTMGGDFTYQSAANWFINMDKLINHVNSHPGNISDVNIFYSTPSCYLKAIYLYGRRDKAIYTEKGDHLPYGSDASTYWTGYYTSRPSFKYFIRRAHVFLQIVKQLTVIAKMGDSYELHLLRHAVNLVLHHDAITGTSQQHVTNDFIRTLNDAVESCTKKVSNLLSYLTPTWGGTRRSKNFQQFVVCHQLNMSQCRFTESQDSMLLIVYNPLSIKMYHHVRLPAIALHYSIRDWNDEEVEYQLVPLPAAVINLPGRTSTVIQELCFEAENIPPLGYAAYYISPVRDQMEENEYAKRHSQKEKSPDTEQLETIPSIANEYLKVSINKETGLLESIQHVDGAKIEMQQNFYYYSQGQQAQQSGAYCFRPEKPRPTLATEKATYSVIRGPLVKEIRQRFTDWITQIIRLYRGEEFVEMEWIVGPVPIGTDLGKEVVTIFKTNVSNNGRFYTDSNGRQMMKRTCWNETDSQQHKKPVSACYFPVTSRICVQSLNTSVGLCVLTDRPQGGTSYGEGEIELMVHRRLLTDDGFGLEESLNEEAYGVGLVVKGKHRIVFGNLRQDIDDLTFWERAALASRKWHFEPWLFMTSADKVNRRKWQNVRNKRYSSLRLHGLPRHVHVLTLEPWKGGSVLLRLENTLEKPARGRFRNEKPEGPEDFVSKPSHITVQLRQLFVHMKIRKVRETTLAANQWLDDARQMDWSTRYVYQGADDEILPEDNFDYKDKDSSKAKEGMDDDKEYKDAVTTKTGNYSEEEQEYRSSTREKKKKMSSIKRKRADEKIFEDGFRKKRSLNISENINENIINGTFKDKTNDKYVKQYLNLTEERVTTEKLATTEELTTTELAKMLTTTAFRNVSVMATTEFINSSMRYHKGMQDAKFTANKHSRQSSYYVKHKPQNAGKKWVLPDIDNSPEEFMTSDEEMFSMRKKAPRKKKIQRIVIEKDVSGHSETKPDLADDGVTKSMFEMYYKSDALVTARSEKQQYHSDEDENSSYPRNSKNKRRRFRSNVDYIETMSDARKDYDDAVAHAEFASREDERRRWKASKKKKMILYHRDENKKGRHDMPFFITDGGKRIELKKKKIKEDSDEAGENGSGETYRSEFAPPVPQIRRKKPAKYEEGKQERHAEQQDDETEGEGDERDEGRGERRKRTLEEPSESPPPEPTESAEEPDYIVTLRPTQIRTFVIHFYPSRGPNYAN